MSLERSQAKAREHQQTGRSLSAWPVHSGCTRSHSLCQDPLYRTAAADQVAAIALANTIARIAWAMMARGELAA
jgi:hypothetical protein